MGSFHTNVPQAGNNRRTIADLDKHVSIALEYQSNLWVSEAGFLRTKIDTRMREFYTIITQYCNYFIRFQESFIKQEKGAEKKWKELLEFLDVWVTQSLAVAVAACRSADRRGRDLPAKFADEKNSCVVAIIFRGIVISVVVKS